MRLVSKIALRKSENPNDGMPDAGSLVYLALENVTDSHEAACFGTSISPPTRSKPANEVEARYALAPSKASQHQAQILLSMDPRASLEHALGGMDSDPGGQYYMPVFEPRFCEPLLTIDPNHLLTFSQLTKSSIKMTAKNFSNTPKLNMRAPGGRDDRNEGYHGDDGMKRSCH
ncbi:hypothetical protein AC579_130 [Pseudocercospora musae]|uniref:Uncharacterized protein n=1 Tax=Pseudocercospora musae TaxID=113226 RepID=A0A139ILN2_9PEZI|nr:hypothetical protein AC579_130 [Pseudocercospora musae]